jgi:hypothetical protein
MNENEKELFRKYLQKNNDEIIEDLKSGFLSEEQYPIIHNLVTRHDLTLNQFEYLLPIINKYELSIPVVEYGIEVDYEQLFLENKISAYQLVTATAILFCKDETIEKLLEEADVRVIAHQLQYFDLDKKQIKFIIDFIDKNDISNLSKKTTYQLLHFSMKNMKLDNPLIFKIYESIECASLNKEFIKFARTASVVQNKQELFASSLNEIKEKLLSGQYNLGIHYPAKFLKALTTNDKDFLERLKQTTYPDKQREKMYGHYGYGYLIFNSQLPEELMIDNRDGIEIINSDFLECFAELKPNVRLNLTDINIVLKTMDGINVIDRLYKNELFDKVVLSDKQKEIAIEYLSEKYADDEKYKEAIKVLNKRKTANYTRKMI